MRKKLKQTEVRESQIGIKVRKETKDQILFISKREARPMSTQINLILEEFIADYFKTHAIEWKEFELSEDENS